MINVQPSQGLSTVPRNTLTPPASPLGSATLEVIKLFCRPANGSQTLPATAQSSDIPSTARQRIEHLLGFAVTKEQPSLAEQIGQWVEDAGDPLTDAVLRSEVQQRLDQPSAINPRKTYTQLIQQILDGAQPHSPSAPADQRPLNRNQRAVASAPPATRAAAIRQFADALVDSSDRQLAIGVANSLVRQRLAAETDESVNAENKVTVPTDSTFGQAWAELSDAMYSEPFKSFAEVHGLDISKLIIGPNSRLSEISGGSVRIFPHHDAAWVAASGKVLAAVTKIIGDRGGVVAYHGRDQASAYNIANFYGLQLGRIQSDQTLASIGRLFHEGTFNAFSNNDPEYTVYAPIKQRQQEAGQRIADLPQDQLIERLARFTPPTTARKVQDADRDLAQQCSQALMKRVHEFDITLQDVPEYSTFNQARKSLLTELSGSAFTTFVRENSVDPASVRINPESGDMTAKVKGKDTAFTVNDVSGWNSAWEAIQGAVKQLAAGSRGDIRYPSPSSATLDEVMQFYNEEMPRRHDPRTSNWRKLDFISILKRSAAMVNNDGFKALVDPSMNDRMSLAVRANQSAITRALGQTSIPLSRLETLSATVDSTAIATMDAAPPDNLENAERALADATYRAMLDVKRDPTQAPSKMVGPIPAGSLFGQWRNNLDKAISGNGFVEWAKTHNVDLTSLRFDPRGDALIGKVNGVDQRFTAGDFGKKYPEYFDVLAPVLAAAAVFAHNTPITLANAKGSDAPLKWVGTFYNISTQPGAQAFERSLQHLASTKRFLNSPRSAEQVENWLNQQKIGLGDSNDRYALINQLKNGNIDNDDTTGFTVDEGSSHHPKGLTTVQKFLADQGWFEAKTATQTDNLLRALQTPIPQAPTLGNRWGFLSTDLPLSPAQRDNVNDLAKKAIGSSTTLLSYLSAQVSNLQTNRPEQALDQLLSSDGALELATTLQTEMKGAVTLTSLKQWLLTALVLELDPSAGTSRNALAGFDLMHADNWGLGTDKIRERFNRHLTDNRNIPPNLTPVVARLLMTGAAPHLLVNDVPSSLTMGSTEWVSFTTAVNRIELSAPGAATDMTFEQVMNLDRINPINARESQLQSVAQMNPVLDWAIVNQHVVKNDKDEYTLEQLTSSQQALKKQMGEVADARRFLSNFAPPERRKMALEALREKFGTHIDYERPYLTEKVGPGGLFSNIRASIVEVYEAGRMGESWRWESTGPDFDALSARASELPDINATFDQAIKEDFPLRRTHTLSLFKDMLSKLPLAERDSLNFGAVQFLHVKGAGEGMVMTSVYKNVRRDFAVYPSVGKIIPIPDINPSTKLGENVRLAIDAEAFKTGSEPKPGVESDVVLRNSEQLILVDTHDGDSRPLLRERLFYERSPNSLPNGYDGERFSELAKVLVDTVYLRKASSIASQRGLSNAVENGREPSDYFQEALRFLPGGSSLEDIYHGEFAEAAKDLAIDIVMYAATEGAGKIWSVAKSGAAWAATKVSAKYIEKFGVREAENIELKDITTASSAKSLNAVSRMQDRYLAKQVGGEPVVAADRADGVIIQTGSTRQTMLTAVRQDGNWYAYDAKTGAAYGPALENFLSDTSSTMRQETFSDGTQALVTQRPLAADAYTLPRTHGFDLINEGKVYRYDTRTPGALSDLESADHFKPLEEFEAICPAPAMGAARIRRGTNDNCFSKVIEAVPATSAKELQALEHRRLFPSERGLLSKGQFVIFERRKYKMVDGEMGPQLVPTADGKRIVYKSQIGGSLKQDPQFGFPPGGATDYIKQKTRVVTLDSISDACKDKRELRGVIVDGPAGKHLVIEADTAEFYSARLNDAPGGKLTFNRCAYDDIPMVKQYRETFTRLEGANGVPNDADFIALPKLSDAFKELEHSNYSKQEIDELKTWCKEFTPEQQREVLYQLQRSNAIGKANIGLKPNRVYALTTPADFATWTPEQKNGFFAREAKNSVNRSMKATGLGPGNQIRSSADSARAQAARITNTWLRETVEAHAVNRPNLILKTGAGNCGEMAMVSRDIVRKSGGHAYEWKASDAHAFTVIGGPSTLPVGTVNFSEAAWADAWIVDPWADIACPARLYTQKLNEVMTQWERENLKIMDQGKLMSPLDSTWLNKLIVRPKQPYTFGYDAA